MMLTALPSDEQPDAQMPVNLQQHVLAMLLFDKANSKVVRNLIDKKTWVTDPIIMQLVDSVYDFIDRFDKAPCEHTYDIIKNLKLPGGQALNDDQRTLVENLALTLEVRQQAQNSQYVLNNISDFHRQAALRAVINKCIPLLDDASKLDEIESIINKGMKFRMQSFNPGDTLFSCVQEWEQNQEHSTLDNFINTGIKEWDDAGVKPERQCLYIVMALPGEGKSWHLIELGKQALIENKRVLHVTLELTSKQVRTRYLQNIFAVATHPNMRPSRLLVNDTTVDGFDVVTNEKCNLLVDMASELKKRVMNETMWSNLIVKEFPMNSLTVGQFETYLDTLEANTGFIPDAVIYDYPDLFKINNPQTKVAEISNIYKDIRGLAQKRNQFAIAATQSNRTGYGGKRLEPNNIAEDFSKYQVADIFTTYYKTTFEKQNGLARMFAAKSRNSRDAIEVMISQNFATGQFNLGTALLTEQRQAKLNELTGADKENKKP